MAFALRNKIILAGLSALACLQPTQAGAENLPRVAFAEDRSFESLPLEPGERIEIPGTSVQLIVYQRASEGGTAGLRDAAREISRLLEAGSPVFAAISPLLPDASDRVSRLRLTIILDDFGDRRRTFASFYMRNAPGFPGPVIGLDCHPRSRSYWQASGAHELTHALLAHRSLDSWFEEALSQLVETSAGGYQPEIGTQFFANASVLPGLLERARPLPSSENYALAYLFAKYVQHRWGGWPTLAAMAGLRPAAPGCEKEPTFLRSATCRAARWLKTSRFDQLPVEKMTAPGILRFFYAALTINDPRFASYSIPGWRGFSQRRLDVPAPDQQLALEPGQAALFSPKTTEADVRAKAPIEGYHVKRASGGPEIHLLSEPSFDDSGFTLLISLQGV